MPTINAMYGTINIDASGGVGFTLSRGIAPSTTTIRLAAGTAIADVPLSGNLYISDGTYALTIPMWVDGDIARIEGGDVGDMIEITLKDRRWLWKYGNFSLDGRKVMNQPDSAGRPAGPPADYYDVAYNAKYIAEQIRSVIGGAGYGETGATFDTSKVPSNKYPAVDWNGKKPAQALQELMDELGMCVCLGTDNIIRLQPLDFSGASFGLPLPSMRPDGVTPMPHDEETNTAVSPELPSKILIVGGRIVEEQVFRDWVPVGEDTEANDSKIVPITDLSYKPGAGNPVDWTPYIHSFFTPFNKNQEEERKLCDKTVLKWFKVDDTVYPDYIPTDKFPWMNTRATTEEVDGEERRAKPLLQVSYADLDGIYALDHTLEKIEDGWTVDVEKGILKFNKPKYKRSSPAGGQFSMGTIEAPEIELTIAYEIRDNIGVETNYSYEHACSWAGSDNCGEYIVFMNELVLYRRRETGAIIDYNKTELDTYCALVAPLIELNFWSSLPFGSSKRYIGIPTYEYLDSPGNPRAIEPDGLVTSVSWSINEGGMKTVIQWNRDHAPVGIPSYQEYINKRKIAKVHGNAAEMIDLPRRVREGRGGMVQRQTGEPDTVTA